MARRYVGLPSATITQKLPGGETLEIGDWVDDRFFGAVQVTSGSVELEAFSSSRSQPIPGGTRAMTRADTNLGKAGSNGLPRSWESFIFHMGITPKRAARANAAGQIVLQDTGGALSDYVSPATWLELSKSLSVAFIVNDKEQGQGRLDHYPAGYGPYFTSVASGFSVAQNGFPSAEARLAMTLPVHLKDGIGFRVQLQSGADVTISQAAPDAGDPLTAVDLEVTLNGLIKRSVV